jgi:hypothetical protein
MEAQLVSTSLPGRMRASLAGEWRQACPAQRFAYLASGVLITAPQPVACLGSAAARAAAAGVSRNVFRREGEYWTVRYEGSLARLKHVKGLRCLAGLLGDPGREFPAVALEAVGRPPGGRAWAAAELAVRPDLGDAGELLDARAKAAYKARLDELAAELGGRDRRAASHAERARLNVTRAIRAAMANLARANPSLGRHLAATIRTGRYCSYTPDPRAPITWEL